MKKRFSIFIVSILVVAFVGCAVQPAADTGDLIYSYSDGAGNAYTLVDSILTYDPITPLESSSGEYSGGAPAQVTLSQANHNALTSLLDEAVADKSIQIENRVKFSGYIQIGDDSVVIAPGSEKQDKIEEMLQNFITRL